MKPGTVPGQTEMAGMENETGTAGDKNNHKKEGVFLRHPLFLIKNISIFYRLPEPAPLFILMLLRCEAFIPAALFLADERTCELFILLTAEA